MAGFCWNKVELVVGMISVMADMLKGSSVGDCAGMKLLAELGDPAILDMSRKGSSITEWSNVRGDETDPPDCGGVSGSAKGSSMVLRFGGCVCPGCDWLNDECGLCVCGVVLRLLLLPVPKSKL